MGTQLVNKNPDSLAPMAELLSFSPQLYNLGNINPIEKLLIWYHEHHVPVTWAHQLLKVCHIW